MINTNKKNPKNAGRKRKYCDSELLKIIELFMLHEYKGDINASILAKFAREKLNYPDIKYYHFTHEESINKKIEDIKINKRECKNF